MYDEDYPKITVQRLLVILAIVIMGMILFFPLVSAEDTGLTRGSRFTITVTGTPNTPYYVWLTRTSTMSGEPGDQPPVLLANQANIKKDPEGGPYVIGSYQINNGGGQTIIDDVAPSTASMSNTQYYALVTTDKDGKAVVAFQTSSNTATRTFSVKVENDQSIAKDNMLVQLGDVGVKRGSIIIDTVAVTPVPPTQSIKATQFPTEIPTQFPIITILKPSPSETTTHQVSLGIDLCIVAGIIGSLIKIRE